MGVTLRRSSHATLVALAIGICMLIANGGRPRLEVRGGTERGSVLASAADLPATVGARRGSVSVLDLHLSPFVVSERVAFGVPPREGALLATHVTHASIASRFVPRSSRGPPVG